METFIAWLGQIKQSAIVSLVRSVSDRYQLCSVAVFRRIGTIIGSLRGPFVCLGVRKGPFSQERIYHVEIDLTIDQQIPRSPKKY